MDVPVRCVDDVFIDLVGDDKGIMLFSQTSDLDQLFPGKYLAGWIRGVAHHDGLWPFCERLFQLGQRVFEIGRMEWDVDWDGSRQNCIGCVILVERGEDDDFVTGITGGHHGDHHGFRTATGNDEVFFRIHG